MADAVLLTYEELEELRGPDEIRRLAGSIDPTELRQWAEAAIDKATDDAVSGLGPRFGDELPTTPEDTPRLLKHKIAEAALYHLQADHRDVVSDDWVRKYKAVKQFYRDVVSGWCSLEFPTSTPPQQKPHIAVHRPPRLFGDGGLKGMLP